MSRERVIRDYDIDPWYTDWVKTSLHGLQQAEDRDRKNRKAVERGKNRPKGAKSYRRGRHYLVTLRQATTYQTATSDRTSFASRDRFYNSALRSIVIDGHQKDNRVVQKATHMLGRDEKRAESWRAIVEGTSGRVLVVPLSQMKREIMPEGQKFLEGQNLFFEKLFTNGGSLIKQLASHMAGADPEKMEIYFASGHITYDDRERSSKTIMHKLTDDRHYTAEGLRYSNMRDFYERQRMKTNGYYYIRRYEDCINALFLL